MIPEENEGDRKRFVYKRKDLTTYTKMKCVMSSKILALFYLHQKRTDGLQAHLCKLFCCIQFSSG